eukprot:CAMPEP_0167747570 /NCGR_PEP_ID=MMETSP0110_2-20121227/4358_1 /TAXON_ID=629695 /ORGANISM="Gymnochlora sp., Strain CCMP2014" /LENGTH=408 /DNA_ID=CAMNT_0007632493 /DNA_START=89 /DNA_END=1316 /DNA_ORIENTATION=+
MLKNEEMEGLSEILAINEESLEDLSVKYKKTFEGTQQFKVSSFLFTSVEDELARVLPPSQVIVALFLIYESNESLELKYHPFAQGLLELAERFSKQLEVLRKSVERKISAKRDLEMSWETYCYRKILMDLLSGSKDVRKMKPGEYIGKKKAEYIERIRNSQMQNFLLPEPLSKLRKELQNPIPIDLQGFRALRLKSTVTNIKSTKTYKSLNSVVPSLLPKSSDFSPGFHPQFVRPYPEFSSAEGPLWFDELPRAELMFDIYTTSVVSKSAAVSETKATDGKTVKDDIDHDPSLKELRELLAKAFTKTIVQSKRQSFILRLRNDSKIVYKLGMTPEKLPGLIEKNPDLAFEVLLKLTGSPKIAEYYSVIVDMDMSFHSIEVVNRLTRAVQVPENSSIFIYQIALHNAKR